MRRPRLVKARSVQIFRSMSVSDYGRRGGGFLYEEARMSVDLRHLEILYGLIGAREKFEDMTVQLIRTEHRSADRIRVLRGDGGIDAYDGSLADQAGVDVFQIKYF